MFAIVKTASYEITGAFPSKGNFKNDNGETVEYDTVKFFVKMPLSEGKGYATVEMKYGVASDYDTVFGSVDLPVFADIQFTETTKSGRKIETITKIECRKTPKNSLSAG